MAINDSFNQEADNIFWELSRYKSNSPRWLFAGIMLGFFFLGVFSSMLLGLGDNPRAMSGLGMGALLVGFGVARKQIYKRYGRPPSSKYQ